MGSVSTYRPKGKTHKEWFQENYGDKLTILETSQARGGALYMAVRHETDGSTFKRGDVFAVVVLTGWSPNSCYNFWYKDMDETMGPCESEAPRKILELLTPCDELYGEPFIGPLKKWQTYPGQYAREWRARCWANLERRESLPTVRKGSMIRMKNPITFTDGSRHDTFRFVKGSTFEVPGEVNGLGYSYSVRIRKWRDRDFELVT